MLSRSRERLCTRRKKSPSLTLKSELEIMNIVRRNGFLIKNMGLEPNINLIGYSHVERSNCT